MVRVSLLLRRDVLFYNSGHDPPPAAFFVNMGALVNNRKTHREGHGTEDWPFDPDHRRAHSTRSFQRSASQQETVACMHMGAVVGHTVYSREGRFRQATARNCPEC